VIRALLLAAALLAAAAAPAAAAKMVEEGGYKYVEISLSGLWGGFFVFLAGIAFCLVGLYLFIVWRRATRRATAPAAETAEPAVGGAPEEDDGRVF
jgi:hypothetical protein